MRTTKKYKSVRNKPLNLNQKDNFLFEHEYEKVIDETYLKFKKNIYVNNLSTSSNAVINIYNSSSLSLFQTETVTPSQNLILNLTDFVPLIISGSGNFLFQITSSVT